MTPPHASLAGWKLAPPTNSGAGADIVMESITFIDFSAGLSLFWLCVRNVRSAANNSFGTSKIRVAPRPLGRTTDQARPGPDAVLHEARTEWAVHRPFGPSNTPQLISSSSLGRFPWPMVLGGWRC